MEKVNQQSERPPTRRRYGQFCALARSLDVVGDRWTLLIVRELLPGPLRYSELKASLSGIATNLLAERLRSLEANGVVERRLEDAGTVYALTPWGAGLRDALEALGRWGTPLLASGRGDDAFQPRWLTLALPALLRDRTSPEPVELGIRIDGFMMVLMVTPDGVTAYLPDEPPETLLTTDPDTVVALAAGQLGIEDALTRADFHGDREILEAVFDAGQPEAGG